MLELEPLASAPPACGRCFFAGFLAALFFAAFFFLRAGAARFAFFAFDFFARFFAMIVLPIVWASGFGTVQRTFTG